MSLNEVLTQLSIISIWEGLALVLSLAYVIMAAKGVMWCWPIAFFASAIYCIIFFNAQLLMDSLLQVYYMAMAIYGWFCWQLGWSKKDNHVTYTRWPVSHHLVIISILCVLSFALAHWLELNTQADYPLIDTFTTIFSIYATYLIAERVVASWLYWIVIDAVSVYIYIQKSLVVTALLFVCYTILAAWAYYQWQKHYKEQPVDNNLSSAY
ncbi:nicotinamide riboside transporter PnuC [Catenovulum adriaticum]|uniref:Nicotinamide riboside transporter PnuC n=1 Tax=Catenovulum adriaticum TaxID=2984846 RepID=A0ABY7AJF6_9ALTE|nr:nicotinamide riboside transporter PnuC [Catenovulum sp. TS8]WAJ69353.1 nicotinamide riboside transporter PnuC [Catenovulum sp. TS8]